jgi:hypothetical protein
MLFALVTKVASFVLIIFLPFCKLILLFMVVVGVVSFTLLRNFVNWCCSCIVPIHHWILVLFTLVTEAMSFALFLVFPLYRFVLLFSFIVGVVNFTLLKKICKLVLFICCSYSSLEPSLVHACDWSCELRIDFISALLQVDYIVHDCCWSRELDLVKAFCKLVLFMHCSCSSLEFGVVCAYHQNCELHIILTSALRQVGFIVHGHCWNHVMLLRFFASKSSSLLFMFVVEAHFSSFL